MITIPIWLFATIMFATASVSTTFGFIMYSIFKIGGKGNGTE